MKFRQYMLALSLLLISPSTMAHSDFADSFRMKKLSQKLAKEIVEKADKPIKAIVALNNGGLEPAANLARALKTNIVEVLNLNEEESALTSALILPQPLDREGDLIAGLAPDGTGWLFVTHISVTENAYALVKALYPKATFATIFQKPQGKSDFYAEDISDHTDMTFYWHANAQKDADGYADSIVTPADLKSYVQVLKEGLPRLIPLNEIKGFVVVTRGGIIPALYLRELLKGESLPMPNFQTFGMESYTNDNQRKELRIVKNLHLPNGGDGYVFIEDMVDTGKSAQEISKLFPQAKIITVHAKPAGAKSAHLVALPTKQDRWITYYWEISDLK